MIDLYTWATPNGRKISIALEELGEFYQVKPIDITAGEQFDDTFLAISPNNKIPAIVDHETGRALMESGAILLYLADKHDKLWGDDRWQTVEWLMLQMGGIGPMLGQVHHFVRYNRGQSAYAETRYSAEAQRLYDVLERRLTDHEYLSGSYSIADIATWPWISRYEWQEMDLEQYPAVLRWYRDIARRPAVRKGYDVPAMGHRIPEPALPDSSE